MFLGFIFQLEKKKIHQVRVVFIFLMNTESKNIINHSPLYPVTSAQPSSPVSPSSSQLSPPNVLRVHCLPLLQSPTPQGEGGSAASVLAGTDYNQSWVRFWPFWTWNYFLLLQWRLMQYTQGSSHSLKINVKEVWTQLKKIYYNSV